MRKYKGPEVLLLIKADVANVGTTEGEGPLQKGISCARPCAPVRLRKACSLKAHRRASKEIVNVAAFDLRS